MTHDGSHHAPRDVGRIGNPSYGLTRSISFLALAMVALVTPIAHAQDDEQSRGEFSPVDLTKYATIVSTRGMFYSTDAGVERLIFKDWSPKTFSGVPFRLVDPQGDKVRNVIMLNGPQGRIPPTMPKSVTIPCGSSARAIHFLSGVSGWGAKAPREQGPVTMFVRLHYADGVTEDHSLYDGQHFADYIGRFDVPKSKFAFALRGQQVRYFFIRPGRSEEISRIGLIKGEDRSAPVVMAVTVELAGSRK